MSNTYQFGGSFGNLVNINDKHSRVRDYVTYMLNRTQSMLKYDGLPDTLSKRNLALMLQTNGWVCIPDPKFFDGKIYALTGGLGGEPDPYYMPTVCTVANPALNFSRSLRIGEECVIIPHDSLYLGLLPIFQRYATMLVENDITIRLADINARLFSLISAPTDSAMKAAEKLLKDIEDGKLGIVSDNTSAFLDGIKTQPYAGANAANGITQLIELQQYLRAGWYNDLGLNANYNMKRESLNSAESQLNDDALLPLIDNIIETQQTAFSKLREAYGIDIRVSLASAWEERREEVETDEREDNTEEPVPDILD